MSRLGRAVRCVLIRIYLRIRGSTPSSIRSVLCRFCRGRGAEVGPGGTPYLRPESSVMIDRFVLPPCGRRSYGRADALPLADGSVDFLVSAHCLEHCPDTIAVLLEWLRVLQSGGRLVLVLPHGDRTFDRDRPRTSLDHHVADFLAGGGRSDDEHIAEFERVSMAQHTPEWLDEPGARLPDGTLDHDWMRRRGLVHYHVWTEREMAALLSFLGCSLELVLPWAKDRPDSFVIVARRPDRVPDADELRRRADLESAP